MRPLMHHDAYLSVLLERFTSQRVRQRAKKFVISNFLVLGFTVGVIWALAWPQAGE